MRPAPDLAQRLEAVARRFDRTWLDTDPLRFPRRYDEPSDREVVAVVAALLAYGRVASIGRSVEDALARLGDHPALALAEGRDAIERRLAGFRHRFTAGEDLAWLLDGVARALASHGSLGAFVDAHARGPEPLRTGLLAWRRLSGGVPASAHPLRRRARAFLLPDPSCGAACKRLLLLARWCVREDDGLDLGLWPRRNLLPRHLLVPLDTHVHRVARQLGLTRRRAADWRAAVETTAALARHDPDDPVRYDFALARPGIAGLCFHRHVPHVCGACELAPCCAYGRARGRLTRTTSRRSRGSSGTTPSRRPSCGTTAP